jgi:hypothetical protein
MAYNPEMEKLKELQLLTQSATQQPMQAPMAAPQMPVQAPMAAPAQAPQAKPSFFQRIGQRFDQAATGGIIDPTTLTKDQRRMLRAQLLMNVGGALSQNRPVGEGFQAQYKALTEQQDTAKKAQAQAALQQSFAGGINSREQGMGVVQNLFAQGFTNEAMDLAKNLDELFPQVKYDTKPTRLQLTDGSIVAAVIGEDGSYKTLEGVNIPPEFVLATDASGVRSFNKQTGQFGAVVGGGRAPVQAPAARPAGRPAAAPTIQETRVLGGKEYVKIKGQWYEK